MPEDGVVGILETFPDNNHDACGEEVQDDHATDPDHDVLGEEAP